MTLSPHVEVIDFPADRVARGLEVLRMRRERQQSWPVIAEHFGMSVAAVKDDYEIVLKRAQLSAVSAMRYEIAADLDELQRRAQEIMDRQHVVVSQGHIVSEIIGNWPMIDENGVDLMIEVDGELTHNPFAGRPHPKAGEPIYGDPLKDSAPELAAIKEVRAVLADKRKMFGIDAPTQISADVKVNFTIAGVDLDELT
jgi:hypothetical protein